MKKKIKQLFIILTPFQKIVMSQLFRDKIEQENSLVLFGKYVDQEDGCFEKISLKEYGFSRERLFKQPLKYIGLTKEKVKEAKEDIVLLKKRFEFSDDLEIYLGTDKDVFTQLIINDLLVLGTNRNLTLVDEGIGYYLKVNLKAKVLSLVYRCFTPLLFGSRLIYMTKLGSHPKINNIYLRAPELLKSKSKQVNYIKFNLESQIANTSVNNLKGILLYSFPNEDYNFSTSMKINLILQIALHLKNHNKQLTIKPHPREDVSELKEQLTGLDNVKILSNRILGESLNYFEYELILNFSSSIIIDLIDQKFPKQRILTIGFTKKPLVHFDEDLKYCYVKDFIASTFINFD